MGINILRPHSFKTSTWTGGSTTQLFIYPPTSEYTKLNFEVRLSLATVMTEESIFTSLPGIARKLLVLDGQITLTHENQYVKELNKFGVDEFLGDWKTSAKGNCTDFNLMTSGDMDTKIMAQEVKKDKAIQFDVDNLMKWLFIYLYSGEISLGSHNNTYRITQGDLCMVTGSSHGAINLKGIKTSALVFVEIGHKEA